MTDKTSKPAGQGEGGDLDRAVKTFNKRPTYTPTVVDEGGKSWADRRKEIGLKE